MNDCETEGIHPVHQGISEGLRILARIIAGDVVKSRLAIAGGSEIKTETRRIVNKETNQTKEESRIYDQA